MNFKALYVNDYFPDGYRVIPAGCTQTGSTVVCDGGATDVVRRWSGSSTAVTDIPGVRNIAAAVTIDPQLGDQRTLAIINDPNVATDSAADFSPTSTTAASPTGTCPASPSSRSCSAAPCSPGPRVSRRRCLAARAPPTTVTGSASRASTRSAIPTAPFNPSIYLSATEVDADNVWAIDFSTGREIVVPKSTAASVRCIRKPYGLKY